MNGTKTDEFDAQYVGRPKTIFSILTGQKVRLQPGDPCHVTVNQYGNAYIDDQYVGDVRDFERGAK